MQLGHTVASWAAIRMTREFIDLSERKPSLLNIRRPVLPFFRYAWLIPAAWAVGSLLLLAAGIRIPIPYTLTLAIVVVSATMGGRLSGFLSALIPVLAGVFHLVFMVKTPAEGAAQYFALASVVIIAIGFFIGSIREKLETALAHFEGQAKAVGDQNVALNRQADKHAEALVSNRQRLLESQQRLKNATRRLIDVQESERHSLAKELHDDIGQSLTALRINLESNKRNFSQDETSLKFIETSYRLVDEIIASVRELSLNLRPSLLDDLGLIAALREYVSKQLGRADIALDFSVDGSDAAVDPTHSIAVYRIVQEITSNVIKHSSAKHVDMSIVFGAHALEVVMRDDGVGFDVDLDRHEQVGLASIRERASLLGGNVEIASTVGKETVVHLRMPLNFDVGENAAA